MPQATTTQIEEALIKALKETDIFKKVDSLGRGEPPKALTYPFASVYFDEDRDDTDRRMSRPVPDFYYVILVTVNNHRSEKDAARDAYDIMDEVRDLFNGKTLGIEGLQPIRMITRKVMDYKAGKITYAMRLRIPVILEPIGGP